jgi:hypothetical protein
VARLEVTEQSVECLLEVFLSAAAKDTRSMHFAELFHVDIRADEFRVDERDHFVEHSPPLRFREKAHR